MRCWRVNPSDEDPRELLDPQRHWTDPWGGADSGRCDKCGGTGETDHACWSCLLTGADSSCPACGAAERWRGTCPVCRGSGEIDASPRHGVSVFPKLEGLYHYMLAEDADLEDCVVVELQGRRSDDADFDADQGALLVLPRAIVSVRPVDHDLAIRVRKRGDELAGAA